MTKSIKIILSILFLVSSIMSQEFFETPYVEDIQEQMKRVAQYQIKNPTHHRSTNRNFPNGWVPASFYIGVIGAYEATGDKYYSESALAWAKSNKYTLGPRLRHADDHACGSVYLSLHPNSKNDKRLKAVKDVYDQLIADPKPGREDWWWCDALFMSPPTLAQLGKVTGDKKYHEFMHKMYWDTAEYLFDKDAALFYRDQRYFYRRSQNGKKVFWSRGNGWVIAGLPRIIANLPETDKQRESYIELFKTLASSLKEVQGADGYWRSSLLDPDEFPNPESSGSGFITYALAWGINQGYLDKQIYTPVVIKGWSGLSRAVHGDGKIGWVQDIGMDPRDVSFDDTHAYGAGAFLLAGSEMIRLVENEE
ncbi:MAG: glycoside hydrolase family 88 protein [Candidatus Marinimicrobia bacterium]|nr:glycoside hydrolase family 88 protein [Candidatus Neomarinimicrobiota bacterium]